MKAKAAGLAVSSVALLLLLPLPEVAAAGIGSYPDHSSPHSESRHTRLFPLLTKLRDGTVEFFFGRHPTKAAQIAANPSSVRAKYTDELVLRFNVSTADEEAALSDAATRLFLDVWAFTGDYVDIRLHADEVGPLLGLLPTSLRSSHSTLIADLASTVYRSLASSGDRAATEVDGVPWAPVASLNSGDNLFFQDYQPLPVVVRWMRLLEAMFPSYVKYTVIGKSFEGREIPALRVGLSGTPNVKEPRKTIVVTGGLHAREWISTSTVNYLAWSFITSFGKERMITKLLEHYDIVFVPAVNPDGIEYTWQVDRLWRKSRQETSIRFCRGLDLDHAFGYEWDGSKAQNDPCSESYGGEQPFQAVEAIQLATWARNETLHNVQFVGLLDLHSYSQQVLFPYSFSCAIDPPNLENLQEVATGISKAIRISNGESYSVTSACEGAVAADESQRDKVRQRVESGGGSAIDWFYHEMRAHFSYQIKLRDTGSYGFLLPKEQIIPTGEEMFNAMKYFGDYLLGNNGIERFEDKAAESVSHPSTLDGGDDSTSNHELRRRRARR
ncbi:Putative metallocarboxypeptidase ecm14 [Purpureocillium takamizusanense]|uniref:Inactive metallocarboxypeptidase ECM14 n=1 Tax=Purpureocillium takamizusanense TaxID=2060973 RepID=A0A9Q8QQA1_9HYPO|nr:Putative metallocarboxypeptidase ecm14 [Purpureocillium takamizusanense]UNI24463.1 Putative metallocarboxypeptidase ecm14 [Purpureocillium takamizusanense]